MPGGATLVLRVPLDAAREYVQAMPLPAGLGHWLLFNDQRIQ